MFQPQAASLQPVQAAVQQVTSQQTQVTNAQATTAQMAAAQVTSATTTVSPSNISVAALQTAGLSINPAIVRMLLQELYQFIVSVLYYVSCGFYTCFGFLRRSMLLHWALSLSFSVPSPPLPSSPVQCPTWLVSPAKSSQMPRDR